MKHFNAVVVLVGSLVYATSAFAQHGHPPAPSPSPKAAQTQKVDVDLQFIDMTAAHHEMGLKASQLAEQKADDAELKAIATQMARDARSTLDYLGQLRARLYPDAAKRKPMGGMIMGGMGTMSGQQANGSQPGGGMKMDGMKMDGGMKMGDMKSMMEEVDRLQKLNGKEFDQAFARLMIRHHEMHVPTSERAVKEAKHDEVVALANASLTAAKKDIEDLQRFAGSAK